MADVIVSSGITSSGIVSYDSMTVMNGGIALDTTVTSGGEMSVLSGGVADSTNVKGNGFTNTYLYVLSGGTASHTILRTGGGAIMHLDGGVADSTTVEGAAKMHISGGGVATDAIVSAYGSMVISSGGTARNVTVACNGGYYNRGLLQVLHSGVASDVTLSGFLYVSGGGVATGISGTSGYVFISGGEMNDAHLSDTYLYVCNGGVANNIVIDGRNGYLYVSTYGLVNYASVGSGCRMFVSSCGRAFNAVVLSSGSMIINGGGVASAPVVGSNGRLTILNGGMALDIKEFGGYVDVQDGAVATFASNVISGLSITNSRSVNLHSCTTALDTLIDYGYLFLSGGVVSNTTVTPNGHLFVFSGGMASDTAIVGDSTLPSASPHLTVLSGGTAKGVTIQSSGKLVASSGAVLNDVTIESDGALDVSNGIVANGVTILSGGGFAVSSGGTAVAIRENGGFVQIYGGAVATFASNTFSGLRLLSDWTTLHSGTTALSATIGGSGHLRVYEGGVASNNTIIDAGRVEVAKGGVVSDTIISGGFLDLAGTARNTIVNFGSMTISSGAVALEIKENGGFVKVDDGAVVSFVANTLKNLTIDGFASIHSGTVVLNAVVDCGAISIFDGGTANDTSVINYGRLFISGGVVNRTTIDSLCTLKMTGSAIVDTIDVSTSGTVSIGSGGTATNITAASGTCLELTVAPDTRITGTSGGSAFAIQNGVVSQYKINDQCRLDVASGGSAGNTTVHYGGKLVVSSGGKATQIVEDGGWVDLQDGANATFVAHTLDGLLFGKEMATIHSGTTANRATVSNCRLVVFSGGIANATTVNLTGSFWVSSGGVADDTIVNQGDMNVFSAAVANGITANASARIYVSSGGVAKNAAVNVGGRMFISSGGVATAIAENGGYVEFQKGANVTFVSNTISGLLLSCVSASLHSGTTANSAAVNDGGFLHLFSGGIANAAAVNSGGHVLVSSGGTAARTEVNNYGSVYVSSGGTLNSTAVNSGGNLYVFSGGSALAVKENGGYVFIENGANVVFAANSLSGLCLSNSAATLHSGTTVCNTLLHGGSLYVFSGGIANATTVDNYGCAYLSGGIADSAELNSRGSMFVESGGTASRITVNDYGYLCARFGGSAADVTINSGGNMYIFSNSVVTATTVSSGGEMKVRFGQADDTTVHSSGILYVGNGAEVSHTTVHSGGSLYLDYGATHCGSLQIAEGAKVSAYSGTVFDFTVAGQTASSTALIDNWSLISGGNNATYTLTVNAKQKKGTYTLAENAADFNKTITVKTTDNATLGTLSVGETKTWNDRDYTLAKDDGVLTLTLTAGKPTIDYTLSEPVSTQYDGQSHTVSVTVDEPETGAAVYYSIDGKQTWNKGDSYSLTDAGSAAVFFKIEAAGCPTVETEAVTINVAKRNVTLQSASDGKRYDGTPLTNGNVAVAGDGFADGEGASYQVTGTQTAIGSSANTFTYSLWNGTKAVNYNVTTEAGTLRVKPPAVTDYNLSGKSDMVQFVNGFVYVTHDNGSGYVQTPAVNYIPPDAWQVTETRRDLTGDGFADIQITSDDGYGGTWVAALRNDYLKTGCITLNYQFIGAYDNRLWSYVGSADFNADGKSEILMIQTDAGKDPQGHRNVVAWVTDEESCLWVDNIWLGALNDDWNVAGTADVTGDGADNLILSRKDGMIGYWDKAGANNIVELQTAGYRSMLTTGDFDGDGAADFLWRSTLNDEFSTWTGVEKTLTDTTIGSVSDLGGNWSFAGVGDYNGDGKDEILWCDTTTYKTAYSEGNKENFTKLTVIA